jgi:outer membrane protein TolC
MERRTEIKELEKRTEARRQDLHATYAGYKPHIQLYGQCEARNHQLGEQVINNNGTPFNTADDTAKQGTTVDLDPTIRGYSAGVEFSWDIFDGFSTHGRVVQARAVYEAAKLDYEDKKRDVSLDVRQAFSKLQEARETLESQLKAVEQGEESLRLARARFNVGAGTQLDVLSAQTALTAARTNYAQALYNWNIAVATLERAMGINTRVAGLDELRKTN